MSDKEVKYSVTAEDRFSGTFRMLRRDLAGSGEELAKIQGFALRASSALSAVALGAAAGGLGFGAAVRRLADDLDKLNDASDALGDSVENISALDRVARANGEGLELVTTAVLKMNAALAEAKADSPVAQALKAINLSAADLRSQPPTQALQQIAVALSKTENDGNRARLTYQLFGKSTREVAAFLNDVAQAGQLAATVTTQDAAAAEKFNKQLSELAARSEDAGRKLVAGLLPGLNRTLQALSLGPTQFDGVLNFLRTAANETLKGNSFADAAEGVRFYRDQLAGLQQLRAQIETQPNPLIRRDELKNIEERIQKVQQLEGYYRKLYAAQAPDLGQSDPTELARRGRLAGPLIKLPDLTDTTKKQITEADRYLERLQKEGEEYEKLSNLGKLFADIEAGRIQGLTPALERRLQIAAQEADTRSRLRAEGEQEVELAKRITEQRERELEVQKFLAGLRQKDVDSVLGQLGGTQVGQIQEAARQIETIQELLRGQNLSADEANKYIEVIDAIKARVADLGKTGKTEFDKLLDAVDRFAEGTIDSIASLGSGVSGIDLWKSFRRDVLKGLIEDPVKETMRSVVNTIKTELSKVNEGGSPLASLFALFSGLGSGSSGGGFFSTLFSGSTSRALGGPVRAGQLVRWQENGQEWMVPGQDGTIINRAQLAAAGQAAPQQHNTYIINGGSDDWRRELQAALDERDARWVRSMRYGRLSRV